MSNYNIQNTGDMNYLSQFKTEGKALLNFVTKPFDALHLRSQDALNAVRDHWNDPVALAGKCASGVYDVVKNGLFSHPGTLNPEHEKFVKHGEMKAMSDAYIRYVSDSKPDDSGFDQWMKKSALIADVTFSQMAMRPLESLKKVALAGTLAILATAVIHNMPGADMVGLNPNPDLSCITQAIDKNLDTNNSLQSILTGGAAGTALSVVPDVYKSCVNQDGFHASFGQFVDIMDKTESALSSPIGAGKLISEAISTINADNQPPDHGGYKLTDSLNISLTDTLNTSVATIDTGVSASPMGPEKPMPIEVDFNRLQAILPTRQETVENERDYAIEMTV